MKLILEICKKKGKNPQDFMKKKLQFSSSNTVESYTRIPLAPDNSFLDKMILSDNEVFLQINESSTPGPAIKS